MRAYLDLGRFECTSTGLIYLVVVVNIVASADVCGGMTLAITCQYLIRLRIVLDQSMTSLLPWK
jgi:hypothetical protein